MELVRVDTQRAYELLWEKITTLELAPGAPIDEQQLAQELGMGVAPVREALRLLAHENLVTITPRHGLYVAEVDALDLEQISEIRLSLETLSARLAAQRATPDDLVVLDALRQEQAGVSPEDIQAPTPYGGLRTSAAGHAPERGSKLEAQYLFDVDHRFHQAVAKAAHNRYLAQTLERLFGLSRRLWYLALPPTPGLSPATGQAGREAQPNVGYLPAAVEKHLDLVEAIGQGDANRAAEIMHQHVQEFYDHVRETLRAVE